MCRRCQPAMAFCSPCRAGSSREHALVVEKRLWCGRWALSSSYFCPEAVGAKARNLEAMRGRLPPWILLPASVAIPFGAFEEMLRQDPEGVCARSWPPRPPPPHMFALAYLLSHSRD